LPMKVVDMFGCGLPVCAFAYSCLDELVQNGVNGLVFESSMQLYAHLQTLLSGFPIRNQKLDSFRGNLLNSFAKLRWDQCWDENALPIFTN